MVGPNAGRARCGLDPWPTVAHRGASTIHPDEAFRWLADIVAVADLVLDRGNVRGVCRDPSDDIVLAAAVEGRASTIVTGDDELLALDEYQGTIIMAPRRFLDLLQG